LYQNSKIREQSAPLLFSQPPNQNQSIIAIKTRRNVGVVGEMLLEHVIGFQPPDFFEKRVIMQSSSPEVDIVGGQFTAVMTYCTRANCSKAAPVAACAMLLEKAAHCT